MKKSYVFDQLQWDELLRVSRRIAEVDAKTAKALAYYVAHPLEDGTREAWIEACGECSSVCLVYGERLRDIISQVMTVYDLQQGIDGYQECRKGWHLYPISPCTEDPGYCPECMPDDAGAEADRRGDERRDAEMEARMEK